MTVHLLFSISHDYGLIFQFVNFTEKIWFECCQYVFSTSVWYLNWFTDLCLAAACLKSSVMSQVKLKANKFRKGKRKYKQVHSCFRVTGTRSVLCFICYFNRIILVIFTNSVSLVLTTLPMSLWGISRRVFVCVAVERDFWSAPCLPNKKISNFFSRLLSFLARKPRFCLAVVAAASCFLAGPSPVSGLYFASRGWRGQEE